MWRSNWWPRSMWPMVCRLKKSQRKTRPSKAARTTAKKKLMTMCQPSLALQHPPRCTHSPTYAHSHAHHTQRARARAHSEHIQQTALTCAQVNAQHSTAPHSTARPGTVRHSTAPHRTAQHGTARHGTAQHSTPQHITAQHTCVRVCMHAHTHVCTHTCAHARSHAHTHACKHTHAHTHTHAHILARPSLCHRRHLRRRGQSAMPVSVRSQQPAARAKAHRLHRHQCPRVLPHRHLR